VQIESSLRPQSPKNGSFSSVRRRLSAISLRECRKSEPGDWWRIRKSPPLAGLSAGISGICSRRLTEWLGREDSNLEMVDWESKGDEQPSNVRSKADTPVRDQTVNRLSNEQLSCSELTGFRVCSEHCCGDLERLRPASGSCPAGGLPGAGLR